MQIMRDQITAGILAGDAGRRMGDVDKGWYRIDDRALIEHMIAPVQPQAAAFAIRANRSLERYRRLGWPVVCDGDAYRGPLAGVALLLQPLHALLQRELGARVERALADGMSCVIDWQDGLNTRFVDWPDRRGFANISTLADAQRLARPR